MNKSIFKGVRADQFLVQKRAFQEKTFTFYKIVKF